MTENPDEESSTDAAHMIANELAIQIEAALLAQASIADCAVLAQSTPTGTELVGYVVPTGPFRAERVAAAVRESRPDLAFPLRLVAVSSIPLSDSGGICDEVLRALQDNVLAYGELRGVFERK